MKVVNEAVEESTGWGNLLLTFASNLVAPEEEEIEGILHTYYPTNRPNNINNSNIINRTPWYF